MGLVIAFALVLLVFLFVFSQRKEVVKEVPSELNDRPLPTDSHPAVDIEGGETLDTIYFNPAEIILSIREQIGMDPITLYASDKQRDKSHIKKGDLLVKLHFKWRVNHRNPSTKGYYTEERKEELIFSPCEGYVLYRQVPMFGGIERFPLAVVYKDYVSLLENEFPFNYRIETDDFDNTECFIWETINGEGHTQYLTLTKDSSINVSFNIREHKPFLIAKYKYKTTKGTHVEFLFEDNTPICFPFFGNNRADNSLLIPISHQDINCFISNNLLKIRIRKEESIRDYQIGENEQDSLKRFAAVFSKAYTSYLEERDLPNNILEGITEPDELVNEKDESCWVYLMHDLANNAYKIGISNNPEYRERTLQSEKPSIEKIAAKQYPSRDLARAIEASLHKVYEIRRLRGEWFRLEPNEVEDVKNSLK